MARKYNYYYFKNTITVWVGPPHGIVADYNEIQEDIEEWGNGSIPNPDPPRLSPAQRAQYLTQIAEESLIVATETKDEVSKHGLLLEKILTAVEPKPKKKHVKQPQRDVVSFSIFENICKSKKPKNVQHLTWSRFKIATTILFFTGLRVSESAYITEDIINSLINHGKCQIYQSKVDSFRTIFMPEDGVQYLKDLKYDINKVYKTPEDILYPFIESSPDKWNSLINTTLKHFTNGLNITSHSFRIGYVTKILKHTSVDRAQAFVGHKDIRSTMKYNRYLHGSSEDLKSLNKSFSFEKD